VVEELVQLLVGEVDAQLLERVEVKVLEPKDVEHTDELFRVFAGRGRLVDLVDQPGEAPA
jgi:hypothetical protein